MADNSLRPASARLDEVVAPKMKVWFETPDGYGFGRGMIAILAAIDDCGSIKLAARALGRSYRHIWGRVKRAEDALGLALVESSVGGAGTRRSELTEFSRQLMARFSAVESQMSRSLAQSWNPRRTRNK